MLHLHEGLALLMRYLREKAQHLKGFRTHDLSVTRRVLHRWATTSFYYITFTARADQQLNLPDPVGVSYRVPDSGRPCDRQRGRAPVLLLLHRRHARREQQDQPPPQPSQASRRSASRASHRERPRSSGSAQPPSQDHEPAGVGWKHVAGDKGRAIFYSSQSKITFLRWANPALFFIYFRLLVQFK